MSDLISRQAAIDALHMHLMYRMGTDSNKKRLDEWINNLPSAQPDTTTHDSIPAETGKNDGDGTSGDCISRQAAIDAVVGCTNCGTEDGLRAYVTKHSLENGWTGGIVDALDAIEQLPSVQSDDDRLERCRFEYVNACKILAHRTPDTRKKDIDDAYAVVRTLNPIFGEESF